ncbi:Crp/Fnr family transcriptional regulator [Marinobacterium zhoushanense]|uniref:Crp/Fnr family transcriptional regulator n=1 Tax=Marinobacterium zhoushanense TaxID=1679163 RepID=A0ABQ1KT74_9GAMM|nr:Crp/Fnr family transcriptional regulator [Marinobacterium zhoushanense]GGC10284.1 Crp/Fnr family transcriptional regulator [Marinobacterium zhoushanense]
MRLSFAQWITNQLQANECRQLARGEHLFRAGEPVTRLFLVARGEVRLARPLSHGELLTVHRARIGMLVAEASIFASHYHCDAIAEVDTELRIFNRAQVQALLRSDPECAERLCAYLSGEILALRTQLELSHIQSAEERILTWIQLHASDGTLRLDRPLISVAAELGLAHETLYRTLKRLQQTGVIQREPGAIRLDRHGTEPKSTD